MSSWMAASLLSLLVCLVGLVDSVRAIKDDDGNPVNIAGFRPKVWPAAVCAGLYFVSGTLHWIHYFRTGRPRYMLTLTISMYTTVLGFVFRIIYSQGDNVYSLPWYLLQSIFILLSPCAFIAVDYILLQKLADSLGEEAAKDCLYLRSSLIVKLFVWSDFITFNVQADGAGLEANDKLDKIGSSIALAGLILQILSFLFFTALLFRFGWRARTAHPEIWRIGAGESYWKDFGFFKVTPFQDWRILWVVMCLTTIAITIRCIFRIVEYQGGSRGYVMMHEGYSYVLDSLPLWIAMTLYAWLWPTRLQTVVSNPYAMQPLTDEGKRTTVHSSLSAV